MKAIMTNAIKSSTPPSRSLVETQLHPGARVKAGACAAVPADTGRITVQMGEGERLLMRDPYFQYELI